MVGQINHGSVKRTGANCGLRDAAFNKKLMFMKKLFLLSVLILSASAIFAQRSVSGTVKDEKGNPIPSSSVQVKGTTTGTTTNVDGGFNIQLPANAKTLVISYVGYDVKEVAIGNESFYAVSMIPRTTSDMSEVIITGYTNVTRNKSPISSSLVAAKDIQNIPITNVNDILQGKAPGLNVMSTTGQPGGSSNVRVRGVGSISAGASPIYVIDGIIIERGQIINGAVGGTQAFTQNNDILSNLNPNDIENITVLKDAAALALYGSRGGNGVIVITTKRGKAGASRVNITSQYGFTKPSFGNWGVMSGTQVYDYERALLASSGVPQSQIDADYPASLKNRTFDWFNAAFVDGNIQSHNISISGGTDKTRNLLSVGYYDQDGTVINSGFKRFTANFSLDQTVNNWLKIGATVNTSYSNVLNGDGGSFFSSPIFAAIANSPLHLYPYKPDGSLYHGDEPEFADNSVSGDNFLYSTLYNYNRARQFRAFGKVYGEVKVAKWLTLKQNVAVDLIYAREKNFFDPTTGNGINAADPSKSGSIFEGAVNPLTFTSQSSASGSFKLKNERHEFDYLLLTEYQRYSSSDIKATGSGIVNGKLQVLDITGTPDQAGGTTTEYAFLSYLGQLGYTFDGKYSLTGSIRRDGSSRFGKENRFATFYSGGASWRITRENFMANQKIFDDLRLRVSYGTSGVADFGNYLARQLYAYTAAYNGSPGSIPSTPGNDLLTWEKNEQLDAGLEFAILNNRIRGTLDVYRRVSTQLLQNVPVSRTSGFTSAQQNIGEMENKGFEVSLNSTNVKTKSFTWTTDINVGYTKNKVLKLYNGQDIPGGTLARTAEGHTLGEWFLPVWAGVDPANGDPLWYLADGKTTTNSYTIASRTENRKYAGSSFPKYTIGFGNTLNYKDFNLSFLFYAMTGSKVYNQQLSLADADGLRFGWNYYKDADKDYWTPTNTNASRPKPIVNGNKNSANASTRWLEKNDYIRLRNVTLSYNLPKSVMDRAHLTGARFFVNGTNLLTITGYKGIDPENALGGNDILKYPVNKSITFGLDITL